MNLFQVNSLIRLRVISSQIRSSRELVFFDSSSNMEEFNLRVFVMVTHSAVGALPLGIIITSDETTTTLIQAMEMFKECLSDDSFYGRSASNGPQIIMTDNCSELREALKHTWPNTVLLLCIFHLMQQVWRWLFDRKHSISAAERPDILLLFKAIVYEKDEVMMEQAFDTLINSDMVTKYPNLVTYFQSLHDMIETWALCHRSHLPIRGNNTNNYIEAQFLVLKDEVLNRTKEININGLLDKLTNEFADHYKVKLLNVASGKFDGTYSCRFKGLEKKKNEGQGFKLPSPNTQTTMANNVISLGQNLFRVPSSTKDGIFYLVDMNVGICECPQGLFGAVCKHQYILWAHKSVIGKSFLPYLSALERQEYAFIAIGHSMPIEFYEGVHDRIHIDFPVNQDSADDEMPQTSTLRSSFERETQQDPQPERPVRGAIEKVTVEECKAELQKTFAMFEEKMATNSQNVAFLQGIAKFCNRAQTFPLTRLSTSLHNFGVQSSTSLKVTATSVLKKARRGKIYVQPEAVKRRKIEDGSRKSQVKGMRVKKNPFDKSSMKKRSHNFSENVLQNEAMSKKAGRSMASKTKHLGNGK